MSNGTGNATLDARLDALQTGLDSVQAGLDQVREEIKLVSTDLAQDARLGELETRVAALEVETGLEVGPVPAPNPDGPPVVDPDAPPVNPMDPKPPVSHSRKR